jgi:hypothetical protein
MSKYRVRQVAAMFILEKLDRNNRWFAVDAGYSWQWAEQVASEYHCQII